MLGWFRKMLPREDRFFDLFAQHARTAVAAAEALEKLLNGGPDIEAHCGRIIALEDDADRITQEVLLATRRSFITPFDRSDIKDLIMSMDDAVDTMHKTVKTIRLFGQTSFEPRMQEMARLIVEAAELVSEAIPLLQKMGPNAARLNAIAEKVIAVEGRSDELHDEGLRALFAQHGGSNAMAWIIGSEIYGELEKVVDKFEDVANEISGIVIENV